MSGPDAMRELTCDEVREMAGSFVLGALDQLESDAVRRHIAGAHAAEHPEIAELGSVIPALLEAIPVVEPPAGLKARIMAAAAADLEARGVATTAGRTETIAPVAPVAPAAPSQPVTPPAPVQFPTADERAARRGRTSTGGWLVRIAAVLAIAVLGGWNLLLQNQLGAAQVYERNVAAVLDLAGQPGALTAVLKGEGGVGSGLAAVDGEGDLAMAIRDLAPTSGTSVYEAWVIGSDGVPVPLGSFQVGGTGVGYLEAAGLPSEAGIVLALTLEAGPGATTPTMPIITSGAAGAPPS